jgi:hypothetical protein
MKIMNITNQELYELKMPQVIIEDTEYRGAPWSLKGQELTDALNKATLESMYRVQDAIYRFFGLCEMREIEANTINPAQQNVFKPLKSWNVNLGGCFAVVSIMNRVFDGCFAEIKIL